MVTGMLPALTNPRFGLALDEVDRWVDRLFQGNGSQLTRPWVMPVALWEDQNHTYLEMELPGISKDDLEIVIEKGTLTISGQRRPADGERRYWYNERQYGQFKRVFNLPDSVDAESIKAELNNGVLLVTLSKRPEALPKRIEVQTG